MTENKQFKLHIEWYNKEKTDGEVTLYERGQPLGVIESIEDARLIRNILNELYDENEELKNKIDALEDDNETYHKSLEKLNLYTKRFIPTKCTNEFKDCKTNRYYWLDHEGNFDGCLELLNLLDCENEVLKSENRQLKAKNELLQNKKNYLHNKPPIWFTQSAKLTDNEVGKVAEAIEQDLKERGIKKMTENIEANYKGDDE